MVAFAARRVKKRAGMAVSSWLTLILWVQLWFVSVLGLHASEHPPLRFGGPARARVVVVENAASVESFSPVPSVVEEMVTQGILALTTQETAAAGWRSLLGSQETIGIKVLSAPGATSGTRPAVVAAVVKSLLEAGFSAKQIIIWDKHLADLRLAGYSEIAGRYGVELAGSADAGYDPRTSYDTALLGTLVWGDLEFGQKGDNVGRRSFVSKLLTRRLTKIINISPMLNHNLTYVSGNLFSLALGSVDNTIRFEAAPHPMAQLSEAIPEICALPELGDRVVLNIVDALICQYLGDERMLLHYSTMLRQLRFSTDPVALDVLSVQELDRQRRRANIQPIRLNWQMFTNASLLELGISDPRLIDVIKLDANPR